MSLDFEDVGRTLNRSSDVKGWSTLDEIRYLRGLLIRDAKKMAGPRSGYVDAKRILATWMDTHKSRRWPMTVDVERCRETALSLIEEMK